METPPMNFEELKSIVEFGHGIKPYSADEKFRKIIAPAAKKMMEWVGSRQELADVLYARTRMESYPERDLWMRHFLSYLWNSKHPPSLKSKCESGGYCLDDVIESVNKRCGNVWGKVRGGEECFKEYVGPMALKFTNLIGNKEKTVHDIMDNSGLIGWDHELAEMAGEVADQFWESSVWPGDRKGTRGVLENRRILTELTSSCPLHGCRDYREVLTFSGPDESPYEVVGEATSVPSLTGCMPPIFRGAPDDSGAYESELGFYLFGDTLTRELRRRFGRLLLRNVTPDWYTGSQASSLDSWRNDEEYWRTTDDSP